MSVMLTGSILPEFVTLVKQFFTTMRKTFVDLCCGVGGATLAARNLGFDVLFGVETNRAFGSIYVTNFQVPVFPVPIQEMTFDSVRESVDWLHASPDVPTASRSYLQVRPSELADDSPERFDDLTSIQGIIRAVTRLTPRLFTLESVPGFSKFKSYQSLVTTLEGVGYSTNTFYLTPTQVGIPQTRNRLFIVAQRVGEVQPPDIISNKKSADASSSWTSMLRGGREEIESWNQSKLYPSFARDSEAVLRARTSGPTLFFGSGRYGQWYTAGYGKPALTVVASQWKRRSTVITPDGDVREVPFHFLCRLMGFPSTFLWSGDRKINIQGLGNAVVPQVLEAVVRPNINW